MAFVYRAPKREQRSQTADVLGPGAYIDINSLNPNINNIQKNPKPFNSTQQKGIDPEQNFKESIPGPGYYNIQQNNLEKVVISSPDEEIKVIEIPKPSSFFKNKQQRFQNHIDEKKESIPGPGAYQIEQGNKKKIKGMTKIINKPKSVIDHLMQINRYSSIPSIPGKQHQFGYTENENNVLELNQLNNVNNQSDKNIGPGCYDIKGIFDKGSRVRGVSWHQTNMNKTNNTINNVEKLDMSYVGPGSYEITNINSGPLYRLKQSYVFASKHSRDQRRGERTNSFLSSKNKQNINHSFSNHNSNNGEYGGEFDDGQDSDSEYEYIEDATPGPGYYHNESTMSSIKSYGKPEKFQQFGSHSERFKQVKNEIQVGPGQYNPCPPSNLGKVENVAIHNKTVPFGSSNTRFETKIFQEIKPSIGQYDPRNTFEDRLIYRIQRGYRGNFGSTDRRFKNRSFQQEDLPGPGSYLDPIIEKENDDIKPYAVFASKTKREGLIEKKKVVPAPGSYNIDAYDITKKVQKDDEDDPELAVKKPGFLTGEPRFKEPKKPKKDDDEDDFDDGIAISNNKHLSDLFKKKPKQVAPFGSKKTRFENIKSNSKVAPGQYYDQLQGNWNKRTFNILFAEI